MHDVPVLALMLEADPVAMLLDFGRGLVEQEFDVVAGVLHDLTKGGAVPRPVASGVGVALAGPAPLLPVGNLLALDWNDGALPPHHPGHEVPEGCRNRAGGCDLHAHASTPTSALVEAKIFSPSLTLS